MDRTACPHILEADSSAEPAECSVRPPTAPLHTRATMLLNKLLGALVRNPRPDQSPGRPAARPLQYIGGDCQLVVICGRNAKLAEKLSSK